MSDKPSIAVCIPTLGHVHVKTTIALCLATNLLRASGHTVTIHTRLGPYTHWNREHLVNDAIELAQADYVMFVDADIVFPTDGMIRLLAAQKPVIGGPYNLKQDEAMSTIKMPDGNGGFAAVKDFPFPDEPFEVAALGTGFMLVDLAAIADLERPLFPCDFGGPDNPMVGEDIAFCRKVTDAGLSVWCDPSVQCGHIGDKVY